MDDELPVHLRPENADRIEIAGDYFIRLEGGIYWRPRRRLLMSEARMTAPQFADALAASLRRSDELVDVITQLRERSWLDVADCLEPHLLKRRAEEAAAAVAHRHRETEENVVLRAYFQGWLEKRGHEFNNDHDRALHCAWDYLALINDDANRTDEDFPQQHRHYAAQNLGARLLSILAQPPT